MEEWLAVSTSWLCPLQVTQPITTFLTKLYICKQSCFETLKLPLLICTHHSYATNTAILVFVDCVTGCILVSSEKQNPLKIMHNKKRALSLSIISIALQKCQNTHHSAASLILKLTIDTQASSSCVI